MPESHERALNALARRDRLRSLQARSGIDFTSNDYLGLAESQELAAALADALKRGVPAGAGGSRLLRGNHPEHEALEEEAAQFFGAESALFFSGGFLANSAIFSTLPARGDLVVTDTLIHASVHEGLRLSKADNIAVTHNDATAFEDAIKGWRETGGIGTPWIAVESLYSMDGDQAPLADLVEVAERHDAMLVIDEAHATGVMGPQGRGLSADLEGRANVIALHTCGKALGVMGGLVLAPKVIREFLINRARGFIYATAPSPLVAAAVRAALKIGAAAEDRRAELQSLVADAGTLIRRHTDFTPSGSHIQPIIIGADGDAVALAEILRRRGFDVRAIRPPTVPEGSARLRISLTVHASPANVKDVIEAIAAEQRRLAA